MTGMLLARAARAKRYNRKGELHVNNPYIQMNGIGEIIQDAVDCRRAGDLERTEELRTLAGRQRLGANK